MSAVVRLSLAAIVSLLAIPSYAQRNVGGNTGAGSFNLAGRLNANAGNVRTNTSGGSFSNIRGFTTGAGAGNVRAFTTGSGAGNVRGFTSTGAISNIGSNQNASGALTISGATNALGLNQSAGAVSIRGFGIGSAAGAASVATFFGGVDPGIPSLTPATIKSTPLINTPTVINTPAVMNGAAVINTPGVINSSGINNNSAATNGSTFIQNPALSVPNSYPMLPGTDTLSSNNSWVTLPESLRRSQSKKILPIPANCVTAVNLPESGPSEIYLLRPTQDISLPTAFGVLKVAKHSCALVAITSKAVTIYDIHDIKNGSVVWVNGDVQRKLLPGWQLTATKDTEASIAELDPCFTIHHGGLSRVKSANGLQIVIGNFSIASAILLVRPLQKDQAVIKTAVIQNMTSPAIRSMH